MCIRSKGKKSSKGYKRGKGKGTFVHVLYECVNLISISGSNEESSPIN